jgi:hypothetical protein
MMQLTKSRSWVFLHSSLSQGNDNVLNIPLLLTACGFLAGVAGCSEEPPSVRVHNERTMKANV